MQACRDDVRVSVGSAGSREQSISSWRSDNVLYCDCLVELRDLDMCESKSVNPRTQGDDCERDILVVSAIGEHRMARC